MLNNYLSITIPSLTKDGQALSPEARQETIDKALYMFSTMFGGVTVTQGRGGWVLDNGQIQSENIDIVKSFTDSKTFKEKVDLIREFADSIKKELNQEAIALESHSGLEFI